MSDHSLHSTEDFSQEAVPYDRGLPGLDLQHVGNQTILDSGSPVSLPALVRDEIILIPGQYLPMMTYSVAETKLLTDMYHQKTSTIFLPGCALHGGRQKDFIATNADLLAIRLPEENDRSTNAILIGRQRILIRCIKREPDLSKRPKKTQTSPTGDCIGHFVTSGNPMAFFDSRLSTWSSMLDSPQINHFDNPTQPLPTIDQCVDDKSDSNSSSNEDDFYDAKSTFDLLASDRGQPFTQSSPRLLARRDVLAAAAHAFTPFPAFVYRQYDLDYLVSTILVELSHCRGAYKIDQWTVDASIPFSYWLINNLPMAGSLKLDLLAIDHVVPRLRLILDIMRELNTMSCVWCNSIVTSRRHLIRIAQEGFVQTYVNPQGVCHDTVTVKEVSPNSLQLSAQSFVEYSWFPGYAWTVASCTRCNRHMGWKFTAVHDHLDPKTFYGLVRASLNTTHSRYS